MSHMTLEYSANLRDDGRFGELCRKLAQFMSALRVEGEPQPPAPALPIGRDGKVMTLGLVGIGPNGEDLTALKAQVVAHASSLGYLTLGHDVDPEDFIERDPAKTAQNAPQSRPA